MTWERPISPTRSERTPPTKAEIVFETIRDTFAREDLPTPPIPSDMLADMEVLGPLRFATRTDSPSIYGLEKFVAEALSGVEDYVAVGHDGHGASSHAMHFYLVRGRLALFVQRLWGGIRSQPFVRRPAIVEAFGKAQKLIISAQRAGTHPNAPRGERLVVVDSDCSGGRKFAVIEGNRGEWRAAKDPMSQARAYVERWMAPRA